MVWSSLTEKSIVRTFRVTITLHSDRIGWVLLTQFAETHIFQPFLTEWFALLATLTGCHLFTMFWCWYVSTISLTTISQIQ